MLQDNAKIRKFRTSNRISNNHKKNFNFFHLSAPLNLIKMFLSPLRFARQDETKLLAKKYYLNYALMTLFLKDLIDCDLGTEIIRGEYRYFDTNFIAIVEKRK